MTTILFPGQGSQYSGMCKDIFDNFAIARETAEEVNDAIKKDLFSIIMNPEYLDELNMTYNTQPALMMVSIAVYRVLKQEFGITPNHFIGHSLGEYTALCASNALSLFDTAQLLNIRGMAMQNAVPKGKGGMVALIGCNIEQAEIIAKDCDCDIANDNGGGQIVMSGLITAIDKVVEVYKDYKIKKAVKLNVSAPFHSSLIAPAQEVMTKALDSKIINNLEVPVIFNVTAEFETDANKIRELLIKQIVSRVRFAESVSHAFKLGGKNFIEVGANKVLTNLTKRIAKQEGIQDANFTFIESINNIQENFA